MKHFVIDTNVLIAANGRNTHASLQCQLKCVQTLNRIKNSKITVLDSCDHIFREYQRHLNFSGQPGVGDLFFQFLYQNKLNTQKCIISNITPLNNSYVEFPLDPSLSTFDKSDHKFVATSLSCNQPNEIVNATDSDWHNHNSHLTAHGVTILQICPHHSTRD